MFRARQLAAASAGGGDETGWFEQLYTEGEAGTAIVPWVLGEPNESLVEWAAGLDNPAYVLDDQSALVVVDGVVEVVSEGRWTTLG